MKKICLLPPPSGDLRQRLYAAQRQLYGSTGANQPADGRVDTSQTGSVRNSGSRSTSCSIRRVTSRSLPLRAADRTSSASLTVGVNWKKERRALPAALVFALPNCAYRELAACCLRPPLLPAAEREGAAFRVEDVKVARIGGQPQRRSRA